MSFGNLRNPPLFSGNEGMRKVQRHVLAGAPQSADVYNNNKYRRKQILSNQSNPMGFSFVSRVYDCHRSSHPRNNAVEHKTPRISSLCIIFHSKQGVYCATYEMLVNFRWCLCGQNATIILTHYIFVSGTIESSAIYINYYICYMLILDDMREIWARCGCRHAFALSDAVYHLILIGYAADLLISNFALVPTNTKTSYAARSQPWPWCVLFGDIGAGSTGSCPCPSQLHIAWVRPTYCNEFDEVHMHNMTICQPGAWANYIAHAKHAVVALYCSPANLLTSIWWWQWQLIFTTNSNNKRKRVMLSIREQGQPTNMS